MNWVYLSLALFVVFYAVWVVVMRHIGQSKIIQWGGGFIAACLVLIGAASIVGQVSKAVSEENVQPSAQVIAAQPQEQQADSLSPIEQQEKEPPLPVVDHNYAMKDGYQYGYARAISEEEASNGQVAEQLMMFKFTGSRDGKFQIFTETDGVISTLECENPCEFMKAMVFYQGRHIKTERFRAAEGSVGALALTDAINGKLDQFVSGKNSKLVNVWFDEKKGVITTPVK